jgi:hypothetical protein
MLFVPDRRHTCRPPGSVTGMAGSKSLLDLGSFYQLCAPVHSGTIPLTGVNPSQSPTYIQDDRVVLTPIRILAHERARARRRPMPQIARPHSQYEPQNVHATLQPSSRAPPQRKMSSRAEAEIRQSMTHQIQPEKQWRKKSVVWYRISNKYYHSVICYETPS